MAGYLPAKRRGEGANAEARGRFPSTGRLPGEAGGWLDGLAIRLMDPAGLSVADFRAVAAAAKAGRQGDPNFIPVQGGVRPQRAARGRGGGPERSFTEEGLERRLERAIGTIRRLEPRNPMGDVLRDPARPVNEDTVRRLEAEADLVMVRSVRIAPGPGESDPATPLQRKHLRENLIKNGFMSEDSRYEAHHIVPGGGPMSGNRNAERVQEVLNSFKIALDSELNGVPLSPSFHRRLHTFEYYDYVNRQLERATSPQEAITIIRRLARRLEDEDRVFQKDQTMPN